MPNYWNIDLHLLACLDALISEKSVTRAAEKMGLTQPGMSHALTRLRDKFSDPLLIRTSHGMVPTDRALYIASSLKEAVLQLQTSLSNPVTFEPSKSENTFKIAISDYVSFLLLPSLMNLISREAPGVKIEVIPSDAKRIREWLDDGVCHLGIGFWSGPPDDLHTSELFTDDLSLISRKGTFNSSGNAISIKEYAELNHVLMIGGNQIATFETLIDEALHRQQLTRRIALRVPSLLLIPWLVAGSPLVAVIPNMLATKSVKLSLPLQIHSLPVQCPTYRISMLWSERNHNISSHIWFRAKVREISKMI